VGNYVIEPLVDGIKCPQLGKKFWALVMNCDDLIDAIPL